ncbi:helix-turn-helix domain-containing protein [Leucobacter ruminantium]|uniref:Helix-turn-helix domain-containing protein n=1 Tax=Leucobacter ruminantium TaxID=1289170 RepID=A0A939RUN6_9MICO|nr:helix-turn-helix domain-containing protein [Leucobacter ruminantium]MBO1805970.1 helix-turn-helix domain-containing protein [Leucobacter ruminantium]
MSTTIQEVDTLASLRASKALTITRKEAAAALGVDPRTVTVGIEDGTIPAIKLGRRIVIPRAKFLALFGEMEPAND